MGHERRRQCEGPQLDTQLQSRLCAELISVSPIIIIVYIVLIFRTSHSHRCHYYRYLHPPTCLPRLIVASAVP